MTAKKKKPLARKPQPLGAAEVYIRTCIETYERVIAHVQDMVSRAKGREFLTLARDGVLNNAATSALLISQLRKLHRWISEIPTTRTQKEQIESLKEAEVEMEEQSTDVPEVILIPVDREFRLIVATVTKIIEGKP